MRLEQYFRNLSTPEGKVDVILDSDAFNEIDDQFAIGYMVRCQEKLNVKGICAAPFMDDISPASGMEKSYWEIKKVLTLAGREDLLEYVFRGSDRYLQNESEPVNSEAADYIAKLADQYSPENPLYIVAIGPGTNVASAILKNPNIKENCVLIWIAGHAAHMPKPVSECNMHQDIAAARIIFGCGAPMVQVPAYGVMDNFATSKYELEHWIKGKNPLCDYLYEIACNLMDKRAPGKPDAKIICDVLTIAWLMNTDSCFMLDKLTTSPIPEYDEYYAFDPNRHFIKYVYKINRTALFDDLFRRLSEG